MPPGVAWCRSVNLDHDFQTCARGLDKIVACGDSGDSGWAGSCEEAHVKRTQLEAIKVNHKAMIVMTG